MRILITGASGFIGGNIVKALENKGHDLVLTSRAARSGEQHDWRVIDFAKAHRPEDWSEIVENVDIAINAVGIFSQTRGQSFDALHDKAPRAMFAACAKARVRRIIQISALGADERANSPYHLSKKRADDSLAELDIEWVILRPSLIIGGRGESWRFFKALGVLPLVPVIGDGRQPLQPVSIEDVVRAVLLSIERSKGLSSRINIVGAQCLTLENYLRALSRWMGARRFRFVRIPYGLAGHLAALGRLIEHIPLNRQAVSMLKEAREFEGEECMRKLGFRPAGVTAFLEASPSSRDCRVAAKQYFLRPLLRYALAFMWLMAGIVSVFIHPHAQSLALLSKLGLSGAPRLVALYGASVVDILLGLALLLRYRIKSMALLQISLITFYTLSLTWVAPVMWSDPFGALAKNVPIIIAILVLSSWEEGERHA